MFWFGKKGEKVDQDRGYEEQEYKTPKAGYVLLLAMFVAAVFFGWKAIDDLQDVPKKPELLSYCANPFVEFNWEDQSRYRYSEYPLSRPVYESYDYSSKIKDGCAFSFYEVKYGVPAVFEKRKTSDLELRNLELELQQTLNSLTDSERQYSLGLQEKIAEEQRRLYPVPAIQQNLESLRQKRTDLEIRIDKLKAELKPLDDRLKAVYKDVMRDYRKDWRWYEFKVFLLEALFVFPFFYFVLFGYKRLLAKNSPYAIIFTALIGVASVFLLRILFVWFWSLFLARLIQNLWNFIQNFALLKSLVFYGGMLLSIVIFGGAVYLLQKRIFDPRRVAIRRLRQKQCPNCQTSLEVSSEFCSNCGRKLKGICQICKKENWSDFKYCKNCGVSNE